QTPQPPAPTPGDETTRAHVRAEPVLAVVAASDWPEGGAPEWSRLLVAKAGTAHLDPHRSLGLVTTEGRLAAWRRDGASWEFDVVPVVSGLAAKARRPITTWKYFDDAVAQSIADNRQALNIPEARHASATDDRSTNRLAERGQNRDRSASGAEWSPEIMAARRNF
ncbi:hypothetical protein ACFPIF_00005, partial [Brevundimonas faecalis]|uniref:hypothetical protein n=1 Tax=Brevundimonas faecalis TaxID=947378 RepID=UPI003620C68C